MIYRKGRLSTLFTLVLVFLIDTANAQAYTASSNLIAQPIPDRTVEFNVSDEGVSKPITWGLDLAWLDEGNIIRGIGFMGKDKIDVVRSSFMPTNTLVGDTALQGDALTNTTERIDIITSNLGTDVKIVLNCDHPSVDSYFYGDATNWTKLIDITKKMHEDEGLSVITVSPFNEPDYSSTGQGTIAHFYSICETLDANADYDNIRISGGNTLNCDEALGWYEYLDAARLDEGNTHQLAGTFDSYATFFETVRASGDHATNDELHNVMEAMVGAEYGLQTGIWWGTAEYARGEFCKASDGVRLGYAEHRDNWTAASVYRAPDGKVQAFCGSSERQAVTTTFRYFSKDRDVYYDGYGPQREFVLEMPGGTGYQTGQSNAERVINITWGDDIQPVIDGKYKIVNRASGKVMEVADGSYTSGANIQQGSYKGAKYQQWIVNPVEPRIGDDFSYFKITTGHNGKSLDILNYSLINGGNIIMWDTAFGTNQQWYLEYAEDGWFYIRSRHSSYCLEVINGSSSDGANIQQYEKNGEERQQWRFLATGADIEFTKPGAPTDLTATANPESVTLDWTASSESDVAGYTVFRAETSGGPYNTIARDVAATSFIDNSATESTMYYYALKAVDKSLNSSSFSAEVSAFSTDSAAIIAYFPFNGTLNDSSLNVNNGALNGASSYTTGKIGPRSVVLDGTDSFIQLPATVANQDEITVAAWVYWQGGSTWQRIFDFGNGESEYMFLTPSTDLVGGYMRFAIKNGGNEQILNTSILSINKWVHIAVTLNGSEAHLYVNGVVKDESDTIDISPIDFKPALNYIGRSQYAADPLFKGRIDDFVLYNYALSADEIIELYTSGVELTATKSNVLNWEDNLSVWPLPAKDILNILYSGDVSCNSWLNLFDAQGKKVLGKVIISNSNEILDLSGLARGIYFVNLVNKKGSVVKRILVE